MKKVVLLFAFIYAINGAFGQNAAVVSAYNYHNSGKLDKAKEYIDKAITNEKTMMDPKTWFYRGNIYIDIYRSTNEEYHNLDADALNKAYEAYTKAKELDSKNQYTNDINAFMPIVGEAYFNDGANKFNLGMTSLDNADSIQAEKDFSGAVNSFEKAYQIYSESGIDDTTTVYYVSVAAELAGQWDKARTTLESLVGMNYNKASIYSSLAGIYYNRDKNVQKAIETYKLGRERYPNDLNLLLNETNLYLAEGMTDEALANLKVAAEIDVTNPTIFFAIGAKYNEVVDDTTKTEEVRQNAFNEAVKAYEKSIELNPDYFDPIYNMGALYVNKASAILDEINRLDLSKVAEYESGKKMADEYLMKSIPYLEKAHEMQPGDISTLASLKEIYARLGMMEKVKEIDDQLKNM